MAIYKIRIKVVETKGKCSANLKVGDEFEIDNNGQPVPVNFCGWAFVTLWQFITPLRYGGTLPWERIQTKHTFPVQTQIIQLFLKSQEL